MLLLELIGKDMILAHTHLRVRDGIRIRIRRPHALAAAVVVLKPGEVASRGPLHYFPSSPAISKTPKPAPVQGFHYSAARRI
jgi:hypothetical protein